jgi:hypothetical protein
MATRGNMTSNGSTATECSSHLTHDILSKAIESLENPLQRDFIYACIDPNPKKRPTAKELLFHPVLFEVHSLKLLAAHVIVNSKMIDHLSEDDLRIRDTAQPAFEFRGHIYTYADMEAFHSCKMDLDKFLEDVKNGIYPLIAFAPLAHRPLKLLSQSPSAAILPSSLTPKVVDETATSSSAPQTMTTPLNHVPTSDDVQTSEVIETNGINNKNENGNEAMHTSKPSSSDSYPQPSSTISPNNLPPYIDTSSATSTITSMTGSLGSPTALEASSTVSSQGATSSNGGDKPQGETRSIKHMRAAIKDRILNMLLQLDDYMNRQLTTEVNENDQAEELCAELITHGFICQEDSDKVCLLLSKVLEDYREEISRGTGKSVEQEADLDQQKEHSPNSRPESLPSISTTSTETVVPSSIQSPQAPKAIPEDFDGNSSPPISMTAPPSQHHQQQQHQ